MPEITMIFHCDTHGDWDSQRMSGCPDCVADLRKENKQIRERQKMLEDLLKVILEKVNDVIGRLEKLRKRIANDDHVH